MEQSNHDTKQLDATAIMSLSPLVLVTVVFLYFISPVGVSTFQKITGVLIGSFLASIGIVVIAKKTNFMDSSNQYSRANTIKFVFMFVLSLFVVPFVIASPLFYMDIVAVMNELANHNLK